MTTRKQRILKSIIKVIAASIVMTSVALASHVYLADATIKKNKEMFKELRKSLVLIVGQQGLGSGVVVKSDSTGSWVITNKHVCNLGNLDKNDRVQLGEWSEIVTKRLLGVKDVTTQLKMVGQVIKVAQNSDLCLIWTLTPDMTTAPIAELPPEQGDKVYNCGNPGGMEGMCSSSEFMGYSNMAYMISQDSYVAARPGSSGSGLFNEAGEVIGLINAGGPDGKGGIHVASVPLQVIKAFIHDLGL